MKDNNLVRNIRSLGHALINHVKDYQPLDSLEQEMLSHLVCIDDCGLIISGYHRRMKSTKQKNVLFKPNHYGQYIVVMNLVDGEENYFKGSNLYGTSLSLTSVSTGEHFAVVYNGLTGQVTEFEESTNYLGIKEINAHERQSLQMNRANRQPRQVFGFGRVFVAGEECVGELKEVSIRSLGSTTISILEVLQGHLDIYLNATKLWNIWWALWLRGCQDLRLEDLSSRIGIRDQIPNILSAPNNTIPLLCYKDPAIIDAFPSTLRSFSKCVLPEK